MATKQKSNKPAIRKIHFPVIEQLEVDGYLMYPGEETKPGLSNTFAPGVNVIVGINGIGKTTLLLMLYRMLTGNQDLRDGDGDELGGTARKLKDISENIFAVRVPDKAAAATATLKFRLNGRVIKITRSLKNLSLQAVELDPARPPLEAPEELKDRYKSYVRQLSGVDDFYDFVLLLRYLVFYLEDRRSLVWDVWAQLEVLRILFLPDHTSAGYKEEFNKALSADSLARNTTTILTREEGRLARIKDQIAESGPEDLGLLRSQVKGLTKNAEDLDNKMSKLEAQRREYRDAAARLRNDAETLSQEERKIREHLLSLIFPSLTDFGAFCIASIDAARGCIVCGSQDEEHLAKAKKRIHDTLTCPLCEADPGHQEARPSDGQDGLAAQQELENVSKRAKEVKAQADLATKQERESANEYLKRQSEKYQVDADLRIARERLATAELRAGLADNGSIKEFDTRLKALKETVAEAVQEKNDALHKLSVLVDQISGNVSDFKDQLIADFEIKIKSFLAERCQLMYRTAARRIGQNVSPIPLLFPEFHVAMTSGVFRESGTPREESDSVSESQKEFIELAFRMAVLTAVAGEDGCSLVIETPEANLDAVFIPRAGKALNEFAMRPAKRASNVIASSNLNGSEMIPALLGRSASKAKSSDYSKYVLNLLKFAAKSAALQEYEAEYDLKLDAALGATEKQ